MKHSRKIIIFIPSIEGGGVEKNLFNITNFLSANLDNIFLITCTTKFNKKFKNVNIISPKYKFWDKMSRKVKYTISILQLINFIFFNRNIVVFAFQANIYASLICKIFNTKIIIRSNSSPTGWVKNFFKKKIFEILFKIPNKIIVNSHSFRNELKLKFNINSTCIYNPLDKKKILYLASKKNRNNFFSKNKNFINIINVGRVVDQKDQITILKALNEIKNKIKFKFIIIGQGVSYKKIKEFITINKLDKLVKIVPYQDNPFNLINKADLFILSSKYEGLPNVLLEAITLKKFIISSNCPTGPKEILNNGKGGLLFPVGDFKNLSKKILFVKNNKNIMKRKTNFAYKNLTRFDYNFCLNQYLDLIKKI